MEAAEVEFLRARGLSVKLEWEGQLLGFPRRAASCDYVRPITFQDVVTIDVRIQRVGEKSVTYGFAFSKDGMPVASGQITTVCCRIREDGGIESMPIPPSLRAVLEQEGR
jgi:4-hydroxybenzoyl-CoA thioesterase/acyl-CoA thioester hydrolase